MWLKAAFYQASQALGNTGKNPAVGCIIVKDDEVVGVGYTSPNGRPHAEENALRMAGKKAVGSTMYISLEPCCLDNNPNSCTNLIIKAGIKRVVVGMLDNNKLTKGKSFQGLDKHGIETELGRIDFEDFLLNYSQYCLHVLNRPVVGIKLANSADSKITYSSGYSKWITSKLSRKHVHQIRSNYEAVLVGSNTSSLDNPSLTVRIKGYKKDNYRIIFDTNLKIKTDSNLIKTSQNNPLIIFTGKSINSKKAKSFISEGIKVFRVKKLKNGLLCIPSIIKVLFELNIRKVLVEGGAKTASSFLNSGYCDFLYIYRSSSFIGEKGLHSFDTLDEQKNFYLYSELTLKDNKLETWVNKKVLKIYKGIS